VPVPPANKTIAVPEDWAPCLKGQKTVTVLPLIDGEASRPGWTTYDWGFAAAPEVEVFCGGVNSKTPDSTAVWRQGFLLHFGFEESPARLNAAGKALLVDAIAYAARCAGDRPIVRVTSPFRGGKRAIVPREYAAKYMADDKQLRDWFAPATARELAALPDLAARKDRFAVIAGMLVPDAAGKLIVDADLAAWNVGNRDVALLEHCSRSLAAGGDDAAVALRLLQRYVPDGAGRDADAAAWSKWLAAAQPYLFFSDVGGYRWYLDALAEQRAVPTAKLRGTARLADRRDR